MAFTNDDSRGADLDVYEVERDQSGIVAELQLGVFNRRDTAADAVDISVSHWLIVNIFRGGRR
jgi:hypothetical protein